MTKGREMFQHSSQQNILSFRPAPLFPFPLTIFSHQHAPLGFDGKTFSLDVVPAHCEGLKKLKSQLILTVDTLMDNTLLSCLYRT